MQADNTNSYMLYMKTRQQYELQNKASANMCNNTLKHLGDGMTITN